MAAPNPRPSLSLWQGAISGGIGGGLIASLLPEDPSLFVIYLDGFGAGSLASPLSPPSSCYSMVARRASEDASTEPAMPLVDGQREGCN